MNGRVGGSNVEALGWYSFLIFQMEQVALRREGFSEEMNISVSLTWMQATVYSSCVLLRSFSNWNSKAKPMSTCIWIGWAFGGIQGSVGFDKCRMGCVGDVIISWIEKNTRSLLQLHPYCVFWIAPRGRHFILTMFMRDCKQNYSTMTITRHSHTYSPSEECGFRSQTVWFKSLIAMWT